MPKFEMTVKVYIEADDLGTAHYAVLGALEECEFSDSVETCFGQVLSREPVKQWCEVCDRCHAKIVFEDDTDFQEKFDTDNDGPEEFLCTQCAEKATN